MNGNDEIALTDYWHRETSNLNERIDDAFKEAQNHAYDLGWQRGTQAADAELISALENILNERGEEYGDCDYQSLWKAIEAAKPAIAHAKAKGQGGE